MEDKKEYPDQQEERDVEKYYDKKKEKELELPISTQIIKQPLEFQSQIEALIPTAGTIQLTDKQKDILYAPVSDDNVEIRPDGLIYLPWMEYVNRLKEVFGLKWAIIPQGMPRIHNNYIVWAFYLVLDGKLAGFAIGEQQYFPNNPTMTYGDACEGAKSNALMRLCKGIGISLELWKPSFIRNWKDKNTETFMQYDKNKGKEVLRWRKKGTNKENITNGNNIDQIGAPSEDFKEVNGDQNNNSEHPAPVCVKCGGEMTEKVFKFAMKNFGKALCFKCQPKK